MVSGVSGGVTNWQWRHTKELKILCSRSHHPTVHDGWITIKVDVGPTLVQVLTGSNFPRAYFWHVLITWTFLFGGITSGVPTSQSARLLHFPPQIVKWICCTIISCYTSWVPKYSTTEILYIILSSFFTQHRTRSLWKLNHDRLKF